MGSFHREGSLAMRHWMFALSLLVAVGLIGCSKGKPSPQLTTTTQPAATATPTAPQPIAVPASAAPEQVMNVFLQAWRTGDSATMDSLLTTKARQELTKHQVHVDPLSSPNAVFQ